ncbi:hypothetical protein [Flavobacterium lacisediminis]|jgi:hypothetical protein|uniref:Uncharacterized protein n=1 Tax=Flavobacterium lacisediminis TaxID=2989705 RepID=A0ABT3EKB6_9FLAO|nr:hypothetical protein [Flavobacterium lacisediminis]MCW1149013.1 hypothetical protein [Flavobacterium lacisediminis]
MKQLLVILTLLMFLKPILPVLEYVVNYDYIVNELCENKLKPELKCNGKCHLTKELAKASEGNSDNSSDKKITFEQTEIVFFQDIKPIEIRQIYFLNKTSIGNNYSNLYFHMNDSAFFHPPTFIS